MAREERQIREEQAKRRPRKRRRRRRISPQAFPVLIALALIVLVGGFMTGKFLYNKYSPSKEMMDGNEYFGLSDDDSMAVIMNNELLEDKAKFIDGRVYLNVETVYQYINSRFYWDSTENLYLYALPTELASDECFILTSNNAYAIRNDNGSFDIYLYGEYLETTNSLEEYGTFPIYDSKEELTH